MELKHLVARLRPRHIELLDALGRDPHLGRCAARLHMSQPTSSKALREIEDIFKLPLFVRNRRGMSPTPMGQVLTRRAAILMAEMQAMHQEYNATLAGGSARLRVGVFPVVLPALFPLWYTLMQEAWPGLALSATEGSEYSLLADLSGGQLDCILGRIVPERLTPDLRHEVLFHEATAIVCGPRHPAARARKSQLLQYLSRSGWILPSPEGASFNLVASRLAEEGYAAPRVVVEAISVYLTTEMVRAHDLLSVLPLSVARGFAAAGMVRVVPVELPASNKPVGFIYRRDAQASPLVKGALQVAKQAASRMEAPVPGPRRRPGTRA